MAIETPWTTNYPTSQDTGTNGVDQMPNLINDSVPGAYDGDRFLAEHVMSLRNKLHAACLKLGDTSRLPVGSVLDILDIASGQSRALRLYERAAAPTNTVNTGFLYVKDVGGESELFYQDATGHELQLTANGQVTSLLSSKGQILTHSGAGLVALAPGTDDYVLTADASNPNGVKWAAPGGGSVSPLTTQGDIWGFTSVDARIPIGTAGQILKVNLAAAPGVEWVSSIDNIDSAAVHLNIQNEFGGLTDRSAPNVNDRFIIEAYSEVIGDEWLKRRLSISGLKTVINDYPTAKGGLLTYGVSSRAELTVGSDGQVLTADAAQPLGIKWATPSSTATDPNAIHDNVAGEIAAITEDTAPVGGSVLILEDYGESGTYDKRRITVANLRKDCDAIALYGNPLHTDAETPSTGDVLQWNGTAWEPVPGGGGGSADRTLVFADDTEFTEVGATPATKKTFRIVLDSDKKPTAWKVVASLWVTGGSDTAQLDVDIGGDSLTTLTTTSGTEVVVKGTITVSAASENTPVTAVIQLSLATAAGATAHLRYTDIYAVY